MNQELIIETEKLVRSWAQHPPSWLRDYLVSGVEDPRLNLQSMLTRHFLIRALFQDHFELLMAQEYRFAAVMEWLRNARMHYDDPEGRAALLYALRKGSDNAEGLEIPSYVLQTFAMLPAQGDGVRTPNYIENFLAPPEPGEGEIQPQPLPLDTFIPLWNSAMDRALGEAQSRTETGLSQSTSVPAKGCTSGLPAMSLLEPACGSANDYRFFHAFGLARFFQYTGFDLCQTNIDNARALFPDIRFELGNVFEIAASTKSFDLCIVHDLFEHLSPTGLARAVEEVCRVTRCSICVGFFQMDQIRDHIVRQRDDYYWNLLSVARMRDLFAGYGFEAQTIHIGTLLAHYTGCQQTHNPDAYTFILNAK